MKKTLYTVLATLIGLVVVGSAYAALRAPDYPVVITAKLNEAKASIETAKALSCEYIGDLTSACYKKRSGACAKLEKVENDYQTHFGSSAFNDCFSRDLPPAGTVLSSGEVTEDQTGIPNENPLFFGDEGQGK